MRIALLRHESARLWSLALPAMITQFASMLMGVVDTLMVGRVSVEVLAATSLGHLWIFGTLVFSMGVVFGIDPIVSQAHGAKDGSRAALALQRGIIIALLASIPVGISWLLTGRAMLLLGQDAHLAELAQRYAQVQVPSAAFFLIFTALRQYLQGRTNVKPAMVVSIVANLFNVVANYALIFGHFGMPRLEIVGAGIATAATRLFMFLALLYWIRHKRLLEGIWIPWSRRSFRVRTLSEVLHHGVPIGTQMSLEIWAFQIMTLLAGRLGEAQLAAHSIVLNMASLSFMLPYGIAIAASTRVGNLIGAGKYRRAQLAAWVALAMGACIMAFSASLFATLRNLLPRLYTADPTVIALGASILPITAAFQLFDGTQVVGGGILRGMGRTRPAAVFNLVGYYLIAVPLCLWLTFEKGYGLRGLWWSLAFALAVVAISLVGWIARRGPAHMGSSAKK